MNHCSVGFFAMLDKTKIVEEEKKKKNHSIQPLHIRYESA